MYWLGTITAASGAYNNWQTGVSGIGTFSIPATVKALYLVPSQSGISFELFNATGATWQTTALRAAPLVFPIAGLAAPYINGPFRTIGMANTHTVSIYNSNGAVFVSVRVYATDTD